ncbi:aminotransferase class III-fold pyridoxal phosphate-dependent enzyme [Polaribacter sp. R77954]|uniref:aminotransferase class III-fold pyridoxal phosphate-dependent enzyme n=1 Tax=Polaribacter sp. R77954 TaxID=3093870 RepID=UPI0037CA8FEB
MSHKLSQKNSLTKEHTQNYRQYFALNRNAAGFTIKKKELIYTLISDKSDGAFIWDIDNNKYIDLTMGFGSILFGHNYRPIRKEIENQLTKSWSVGPISSLAGILAEKITIATKTERVAFFNSGTEAIMVALRIAKAATKKNRIVFFKGAYHGTFDSLLTLKSDQETKIAKESIPGITQNILNESYFFEYGSDESLEFIKNNKDEIAAVLVEPVQSRNPSFQPIDFLKELRKITAQSDIALIFDEVITGFRIDIGGCQKKFDIQADIVTYGKVIGGGLPIGIVAGKSKFLDAIDGGFWQYGDESIPKAKATFVAGTFCHHPLAMATSLKTLEILNSTKGELLIEINMRTTNFCARMNAFFKEKFPKLSIVHFGSLFRFVTPGKYKELYHHLLLNGVYIWEGRNCFFSAAHSDDIIVLLEDKIKLSCNQLLENGIIKT